MLRRAIYSVLALALSLAPAWAQQTSGSFQVGVTIGKVARQKAVTPVVTYTWGAAEISVMRGGFHEPTRLKRTEMLYWFATRRDGVAYRVAVSIVTGKIVAVVAG